MRRRRDRGAERAGSSERGLEIEFEIVDDPPASGQRTSRGPTVVAVGVLAAAALAVGTVAVIDAVGDERTATPPVPSSTTVVTTSTVADGDLMRAAAVAELVMPSFEGITVPSFPAAARRAVERIDRSLLDRAVERLGFDVPRRSTTQVLLGDRRLQVDVTILRDPVADRYELTVDSGSGPSSAIFDVDSGLTYFTTDGRRWSSFVSVEVAERLELAHIGELYERLLLGPLRPDSIGGAEIAVTGPVDAGRDGPLGGFRVRLGGESIPLWQLYHFAPDDEFDPRDRPVAMVYDVYAGDDVEVVVGLSAIGGVPQLVRHEIERLPSRIPIVLPGVRPIAARGSNS